MPRHVCHAVVFALLAAACGSGDADGFASKSNESKLDPSQEPNFIIVDLKMTPAVPVPGDNVVFTMTVENIGAPNPAGQQLNGAFFVNGIKSTWSVGIDVPLPQYGYRDLIANGGPYNGNAAWYRWGDYQQTVTAVVNDENVITESNTGDNAYTKAFSAPQPFYGVNGHYDYPFTPEELVSILKDLGVTSYRINTGPDDAALARAVGYAKALVAAGINVLPVLDNGIIGVDEASGFAGGYQVAVQKVLAFAGLGIDVYEVGNELDRKSEIFINPAAAGNARSDYAMGSWPQYRGTVRGMIEGVHAAQYGAHAGVDFCGADIAAADMLWDGTQPDGASGFPQARWDVTMWHNYEINLQIFNIGVDGGGTANPPLNIPEYAKRYNNNPFWLTEFGSNGGKEPEDQVVSWINAYLPNLWNNRYNDNISAIFLYQLDGDYGLMRGDTTRPIPYNGEYYAYQSFISAHRE